MLSILQGSIGCDHRVGHLWLLVFVCMHTLRTLRTPRARRTRTAPDAARSRPMRVRGAGGVSTPSTIRRRTPPETGCPLVGMFMVARGTPGATRASRPRCAIHACPHRSALPSCRVPLSHPSCARGRRAGGHTPGGVVLGLVSPAHTPMLCTLPEVVELPTSMVPNCTPYSLLFAHRLHAIYVTT